jgi:hypothetical protein
MLSFDLCPSEERELYDLALKLKSAHMLYKGWHPESGRIAKQHVRHAFKATMLEGEEGIITGCNGTLHTKIKRLFRYKD